MTCLRLPEGTPVFANEPIAIVRAPLVEAQLVETYLLSTFVFQTMVASKAARCTLAAEGRTIVEFGSRRAHSPGAGILAGRAAFIGGCAGTSNAESGMRFGIPVFGTAAHSWTMAFGDEESSFRALQKLLGDSTVFLIDTYDTIAGAHLAAEMGRPIWGVRLDSGNLAELAKQVRRILDDAGLQSAKIFATNDLDEYRVAEIVKAGVPIDAFRYWNAAFNVGRCAGAFRRLQDGRTEARRRGFLHGEIQCGQKHVARSEADLSLPRPRRHCALQRMQRRVYG